MWRHDDMRRRLLAHWQDERHPHRDRFAQHREQVELAFNSNDTDEALNRHSPSPKEPTSAAWHGKFRRSLGIFSQNRACLFGLGCYPRCPEREKHHG